MREKYSLRRGRVSDVIGPSAKPLSQTDLWLKLQNFDRLLLGTFNTYFNVFSMYYCKLRERAWVHSATVFCVCTTPPRPVLPSYRIKIIEGASRIWGNGVTFQGIHANGVRIIKMMLRGLQHSLGWNKKNVARGSVPACPPCTDTETCSSKFTFHPKSIQLNENKGCPWQWIASAGKQYYEYQNTGVPPRSQLLNILGYFLQGMLFGATCSVLCSHFSVQLSRVWEPRSVRARVERCASA